MGRIGSKEDVLVFVESEGECTLFPTPGFPDLYSNIEGGSADERRSKAWNWSDELNLEKRLFLSLAIKGRVTLTSWRRFEESYEERSRCRLLEGEKELLGLLRKGGVQSSSKLRVACGLGRVEFERALKGLRTKMLVAIVGIQHVSATKHVYVYDLTERSVPFAGRL